jgi:catechol 2,3-dioxygenase-like lactoylglutathione lyase family enzyme
MRRVVEIALFTSDPDKMIGFYEQLLGALPARRWDGGATFELGELTLLIHADDPNEAGAPANRDHVAFGFEDVDAAAARLRDRGFTVDGPKDYYWGRSAYLHDPDGRMLELHRPE